MRFIASVVLALLIATGAASACQPPPPPPAQEAGESDEAYGARLETLRLEEAASVLSYQRWLWDAAETVLIARIEQRTHTMLGSWEMPRVIMRPARWLKGAGAETTFDLAVTIGPCGGSSPNWDA